MMKKLCSVFGGNGVMVAMATFGAVWTLTLVGCDGSPPERPPTPVVSIEIPEDESVNEEYVEVLTDMLREPDAFTRARRLATVLPTLGPEYAPAAAKLLGEPNFSLRWSGADVELMVRLWATHQPEEASQWAVLKSPSAYRHSAIFASVPLWAERDPQAVAAAVADWGPVSNSLEAVEVAQITGWFAAGNPPELREYIYGLGEGWGRQRAISAYVRELIRAEGIEAATRWADSIPDDQEAYKRAVFRQVGFTGVLVDLDATVRWCREVCAGPWAKDLPGTISRRWALHDGAAAMEWLAGVGEADTHEKNLAVRLTFETWLQVDREAALAWMAEQTSDGESDEWLEPIYPVYAEALALDSPAEAIVWAERTKKKWNREFALIKVARAWRQIDEAAAEEWLEQSSLSEESREKVRAPSGPLVGSPAAGSMAR